MGVHASRSKLAVCSLQAKSKVTNKMKWIKFSLITFLISAILGPIGDFFHVHTHATSYPPFVYGYYFLNRVPWWVPILFGSAGLSIALSTLAIDKRRDTHSFIEIFIGFIGFLGLYISSGYLPHNLIADAIIASGAILIWYFLERTRLGLFLAISNALFGTAFEIMLVKLGVFSYSDTNNRLFGVASWLPWLYVAVSVGVGNFARFMIGRL